MLGERNAAFHQTQVKMSDIRQLPIYNTSYFLNQRTVFFITLSYKGSFHHNVAIMAGCVTVATQGSFQSCTFLKKAIKVDYKTQKHVEIYFGKKTDLNPETLLLGHGSSCRWSYRSSSYQTRGVRLACKLTQ